MHMRTLAARTLAVGAAVLLPAFVLASSHREAPAIAGMPRVDASDFGMFSSYEAGRAATVTLIANYVPLQDAYGGPNYFPLDAAALYEISVDNNGDAAADITFQFRFTNNYKNLAVPTGASGNVVVPLGSIGQIDVAGANLNVQQSYALTVVRGDRRTGTASPVANAADASTTFQKPADNIGLKSIPDYAAYAGNFVYGINIPGCSPPGQSVRGPAQGGLRGEPRRDLRPGEHQPRGPAQRRGEHAGEQERHLARARGAQSLPHDGSGPGHRRLDHIEPATGACCNPKPSGPNATSLQGGPWVQVSRLGMPLVNEVVIGLPEKDKFNASEPKGDAVPTYDNPTLPGC